MNPRVVFLAIALAAASPAPAADRGVAAAARAVAPAEVPTGAAAPQWQCCGPIASRARGHADGNPLMAVNARPGSSANMSLRVEDVPPEFRF